MLRTVYERVFVRVHRFPQVRSSKMPSKMETHVKRHRVRNLPPTVYLGPSRRTRIRYVLPRDARAQTPRCYDDHLSTISVSLFRSRRVRRQLLVHMNQFNGQGTERVPAETASRTHTMSSAYPSSHSTQLVPFVDVHSSTGTPLGHTQFEHVSDVDTGPS